jgi:hypothetical protein
MPRGAPAHIMGIWLRRIGEFAVVSAEDIYGHDVELIREPIDAPFSHNISEHGINKLFSDNFWALIEKEQKDDK